MFLPPFSSSPPPSPPSTPKKQTKTNKKNNNSQHPGAVGQDNFNSPLFNLKRFEMAWIGFSPASERLVFCIPKKKEKKKDGAPASLFLFFSFLSSYLLPPLHYPLPSFLTTFSSLLLFFSFLIPLHIHDSSSLLLLPLLLSPNSTPNAPIITYQSNRKQNKNDHE